MKLLHNSIYDPLIQTKRTLWWFARLTINSISGCFRRFIGKFLKQTERLKRHSAVFLVGKFQRKFGFHVFKPFLNISFGLSRPFFVKRNWLRQMVNAITERNQTSSVLNSVHHLPKLWSDRFTHITSRKALCPKACDTASSQRYLPLGTFRQRAVRGGCIVDYASYILSTLRGLVKYIVARSNGRSLQYLLLLFKRHQHKTGHSSTPYEC